MRRTILLLVLVLIPAVAASGAVSREDVVLTGDGTLFLVRVEEPSALGIESSSRTVLVLTTFRSGEKETNLVPGSSGGLNVDPTLAWDEQDQRLYVLWTSRPSITSSELVITSCKDGAWTPAARFGLGKWTFRMNLSLALTRQVERETADGLSNVDRLTVHAIWWNQEGSVESAQHAMFTLDGGRIVSYPNVDLINLVADRSARPAALPEDFDRDILRKPFVLPTIGDSSLDVIFADWTTANFYFVTLTPRETQDGRLRIPLGVAGREMGPPLLNQATELSVERRRGGGSTFVVYSVGKDVLEYVSYENGVRGETRELALDGDLTPEGARTAISRFAESQAVP